MKFFIFLLCLGAGLLMITKTQPIVDNFTGRIGWAERNLGGGGTYTLMKLLGAGAIIFGMMYVTGTIERSFGGLTP
jgi:hypothetical protein